jgi:ABC-type glycerol-3-phosphate transport system permease component
MKRKELTISAANSIVVYVLSVIIIVPVLIIILGSFKTSGEAL